MSDDALPKLDDADIRAALKAKAVRPYYYVLAPDGNDAGVLLVGRKKFNSKVVSAAKKKANVSVVLTGVCHGEEGKLVFENPKPPQASWSKAAKALIKKGTNQKPETDFRLGRSDDDVPDPKDDDKVFGGSSSESSGPSTGSPSDTTQQETTTSTQLSSGDRESEKDEKEGEGPGEVTSPEEQLYNDRVKVLVPAFQQAMQRDAVGMRKLVPLLEMARGRAKEGNHAAALTVLDKFEGLLGPLGGGKGEGQVVKDKVDSGEPAYKLKLAETMQRVKELQTLKGVITPDIVTLMKEASELAHKGSYAQALLKVQGCDAPLDQVNKKLVDDIVYAFVELDNKLGGNFSVDSNDPKWFSQLMMSTYKPLRQKIKMIAMPGTKATAAELRQHMDAYAQAAPQIEEAGKKRALITAFVLGFGKQVEAALNMPARGDDAIVQAQAVLRKARDDRTADTAHASATVDQTARLLTSLRTEYDAVLKASSDRVAKLAGGKDAKKSAVRGKVMELMVEDPDLLSSLVKTPEGIKLLDELVADIGKTAKGKTDNAFMAKALNARYGCKFSGDLAASAGPRLYKVFGIVPDSHTLLNPKIKEVKRNANYEGFSWYSEGSNKEEGVGEDHMVINGARTGGLKGWVVDTLVGTTNPVTKGATKYRNVKGDKKINAFDAVTLHEIAHGVDANLKFMDKKGSSTEYGGWLEHDVEEVADIVGAETGFYDTFKDQPRPLLRGYLLQALSKGFDAGKVKDQAKATAGVTADMLLNDPGVKAADEGRKNMDKDGHTKSRAKAHKKTALKALALKGNAKTLAEIAIDQILADREAAKVVGELMSLAPSPGVDWTAMSKHEAVRICQGIKMSGKEGGLWEKGEGAAKYALGGRVYQEAYSGDWNSYELSARGRRVTNYQFRAPGEWFADAYSAFYLGKLPDDHPLTDWLNTQRRPGT